MKKIKKIIAIVVSVVIAISALPLAFWVSGVQSGSKDYIIWQASTDMILGDSESKVNGSFAVGYGEAKYDVFKKVDESGSFFNITFAETGNGVATNYALGESKITDKTSNFGWLNSEKVLNALAPYLYVGFDYRVKGSETLPTDTTLTLNAAQPYNGAIAELAKVNVSGAEEWKEYPVTKINSSAFAKPWYSGSFTASITSALGTLSGTQTVDIRNIILIIKETDKNAINQTLNKVTGITSIANFTKDVYVDGTTGRKDYFKLFNIFDKYTAQSGRNYDSAYNINIDYVEKCDISLSRTKAKGSQDINFADAVTVNVKPEMNYNIKNVTVTAKNGTIIDVATSVRNSQYTFTMPPQDVTVSAEVVYEEEREIAFLWKNDPGTYSVNPWYSNSGGSWQRVDGGDTSAYQFTISKNQGVAYVYGANNVGITVERYFNTAYFYTSLKLVTESEDRTVKIGITDNMYYEVTVPESDKLVPVKIPLKDIAKSATFGTFKIDLTNRQAGDIITVGETVVFNKEIEGTIDEAWAKIYNISHYEKNETNTLLGVIGDTEGTIDPWAENRSDVGTVVSWDLAWYYSFQNIPPYILIPQEDLMGKHYFTTFYGSAPIDASDCVDTGYLEFFIYSDTDGIEVPFSVESGGHANRHFVSFSVIYDKSKARDDGYMRVQIPFTYLSDSGANMDNIVRVTLKGNQTSLFCEYFLISSFRFYDRYADVPEPEPIVVPEPEPERDLPLELDEKIINAKLDKENMVLYVPEDTKMWEILAALTFDTDETNVEFYNVYDKKVADDDETVLTNDFDMIIYRRDYYLNRFIVKPLVTETTTTQTVTVELDSEGNIISEENYTDSTEEITTDDIGNQSTTKVPQTGDNSHPTAALLWAIISGLGALTILVNHKKIFN